jgi:hypothetical protein
MAEKKHTEPVLPKRSSTLVGRGSVPAAIKARADLERQLRVHDSELVEEARSRIKADQLPLVRRIALDPAEGEGMVARKHAIALLASRGANEDLNLLSELARFDAEPAIRAEALTGLGRSGLAITAGILVEAIASNDRLEATAASKALAVLAQKAGIAAVRAQVEAGPAKGKKLAAAVLEKAAHPVEEKAAKRSVSRPDPNTKR